jgi:hypothetical protein
VTPQTVNPLNAAKAVSDLRQSTNREKFQLPNRAKIGDVVNNDDKKDTILDQSKGTVLIYYKILIARFNSPNTHEL